MVPGEPCPALVTPSINQIKVCPEDVFLHKISALLLALKSPIPAICHSSPTVPGEPWEELVVPSINQIKV
jgi:hypothetical protein